MKVKLKMIMKLKKQLRLFISLVHKQYKGQVAIFVALIFQVIFILFALLINVGLLIHHKINLQQSTDLAAYYGAMKQAEMLNVIGHVNFQVRQAYKLLTWRYRILGTFGFETKNPGGDADSEITFPISKNLNSSSPLFTYNRDSENEECNVLDAQKRPIKIKPSEFPFMCMVHFGFADYPSNYKTVATAADRGETFCRLNCGTLASTEFTQISNLPPSTISGSGFDTAIITSINAALSSANKQITEACEASGPITAINLVKFYLSYTNDIRNKMLFMKMLFANLSAEEKSQLDIEGNSIFEGVEKTLKNNLTEANNTSLKEDKNNIFEVYNSLSPQHGRDCNYSQVNPELKQAGDNSVKLFNELNFRFIQYFLLKCNLDKDNNKTYKPGSIYDNQTKLDGDLFKQLEKKFPQQANEIKKILEEQQHSIGIEKNPWCSTYYGVKSTTTPVIPFLPISKIKLHAVSFAKPFGGSIGPKAFKQWSSDSNKSNSKGGDSSKVDANLPILDLDLSTLSELKELKDQTKTMLNFSRYIGDEKGLSDTKYIAQYHDMLKNRTVSDGNVNLNDVSTNKTAEPAAGLDEMTTIWPAYSEWSHITEEVKKADVYDPLARDNTAGSPKNSYMRDMELSVVAPNQFDLTYYSIEPDFYNVYVKNKLDKALPELKKQAGLSGTGVVIPKDYGHTEKMFVAGTGKSDDSFSILKQLSVVQHIFRRASPSNPPTKRSYGFGGTHSQNMSQISDSYFSDIPYLPGSLLTGWTMQDFISDDYSKVQTKEGTMPFMKCNDENLQGNSGFESISLLSNPNGNEKLPAAPGNCITGGRTGYSVKLVSPNSLNEEHEYGGESSNGTILNPPDSEFISF